MLSRRTKLAFAQFLSLQPPDVLRLLLNKYNFAYYDDPSQGECLARVCLEGESTRIHSMLDEVLRTGGDLRNNVNPRYRFDQRLGDLERCLELDGYRLNPVGSYDTYEMVSIEPAIEGAVSAEDDLSLALGTSALEQAEEVRALLNHSADAFRRQPPDYNACLTNARIALQTLGTAVAKARAGAGPFPFEDTKWGQVVAFLRRSELITEREEEGLTGVYSFISEGAHVFVGLDEQEMTRLGRSLAVSMCYFLLKRHLG